MGIQRIRRPFTTNSTTTVPTKGGNQVVFTTKASGQVVFSPEGEGPSSSSPSVTPASDILRIAPTVRHAALCTKVWLQSPITPYIRSVRCFNAGNFEACYDHRIVNLGGNEKRLNCTNVSIKIYNNCYIIISLSVHESCALLLKQHVPQSLHTLVRKQIIST